MGGPLPRKAGYPSAPGKMETYSPLRTLILSGRIIPLAPFEPAPSPVVQMGAAAMMWQETLFPGGVGVCGRMEILP